MKGKNVCARHHRPVHPADANLPYDEVTHKIDDSILSVKLIKDRHDIQTTDGHAVETTPPIDVDCFDKYGKKCKKGCPKVNMIHNQVPTKKPEEEILLLRSIRQITGSDDMRHSLEVEFKSPRNYTPLPGPGPPPPIIIPKQPIIVKTDKIKKKKKDKRGGKKKKVKR